MDNKITKLFTGSKDYNIKDLYVKDNDQYKCLINTIEEFYKENYPNSKNTYLGTEDLHKDTKFSICRFYYVNNKLIGISSIYFREKNIKINDKDQVCYIVRGFGFITKNNRGDNESAGFTLKYLAEFLKEHNEKPTFIYSKSTSPLTIYNFTKYFNGYVGLPTTLIELNQNPQLKKFLAQISNKMPYDIHKLCDSITETMEPSTEQTTIYKKCGRVFLTSTIADNIQYKPDNNYKKEILFKLFENQEYKNTQGYAIPTLVLINKRNVIINYIMFRLIQSFKKLKKFFSSFFYDNKNK